MIDYLELKIGNWIWSNLQNRPIKVEGIKRTGEIDITKLTDPIDSFSDPTNFLPIPLHEETIKILIRKKIINPLNKNGFHFFTSKSAVYGLVPDININHYYIGLFIRGETYRITRPFNSLHKLQNAYNIIYDERLELSF